MKKRYVPLGTLGALTLLLTTGVLAAPPASNTHAASSAASTATPSAAASGQAKGKAKLAEAQQKSCQAKEAAITKRSTQMEDRAAKMETKFADIAGKVDGYYTAKLVPDGKTVSNYSALKGDIDTKKAAVDTALSTSKADLASFSCTGDDPKGAMTSFKTDMQGVGKALKDYRIAIKNFTKALHQAVGDSSSATASPEAAN